MDGEFDFEPAEEAEGRIKGHNRRKESQTAESGGDKTKTKRWSKVVKGLKTEDELETTNSDERGIESELFDSIKMFDLDTPNQRKAKRRKGQ